MKYHFLLSPMILSLSDVQRVAKTDLEDATVPRASVEVVSAHALLLIGSVIQMSAEIAG